MPLPISITRQRAMQAFAQGNRAAFMEIGQIIAVGRGTATVRTARGTFPAELPVEGGSPNSWSRRMPEVGTQVYVTTEPYGKSRVIIRYIAGLENIANSNDPTPMYLNPASGGGLLGLEIPEGTGIGTGVPTYSPPGPTMRKANPGEQDDQTPGLAFQYKSARGNHYIGSGPIRTIWSMDEKYIKSSAPFHWRTFTGQGTGELALPMLGDEERLGIVYRTHPIFPFKMIPIRDFTGTSKNAGFAKEYVRIIRNSYNNKLKTNELVPNVLVDTREGHVIDDLGIPLVSKLTGQPLRRLSRYYDMLGFPVEFMVDTNGNIIVNQALNQKADRGAVITLAALELQVTRLINIVSGVALTVNRQGLVNASALALLKSHKHPGNGVVSPELVALKGGVHTTSLLDKI